MGYYLKTDFFRIFWLSFIVLIFSIQSLKAQTGKEQKRTKFSDKNEDMNIPDSFMHKLLAANPGFYNSFISKKDIYKIQLIYTQIDRDKKGKIKFIDHPYNLNNEAYYYPASTVKLPIAILALQKLNELKIPGLNKNSTMITGTAGGQQTAVTNDPSAMDGRPTIAHYIKKILLVSDNDAFNRLYEFLGQEYINNSLHKMGFDDVQIIHRLQISLPEEENRFTNPVQFLDSTGKVLFDKPAEKSQFVYANRNTKLGNGYMRGDKIVNEPFDFSKKNRLGLADLHNIVKSIMFPDEVPDKQRFNLTADDYIFLRRYMSMLTTESVSPVYTAPEYWDTYVKFMLYGAEKEAAKPGIRIFNKPGDAYGFMIDGTYIVDFINKVEFIVSAVIYCNSDGIFNDDQYDYDTVGRPFFKQLGEILYQYELKRERKFVPDLHSFQYRYND